MTPPASAYEYRVVGDGSMLVSDAHPPRTNPEANDALAFYRGRAEKMGLDPEEVVWIESRLKPTEWKRTHR